MSYLYFKKDTLVLDKAHEHKLDFKDIKELLQKETLSGAYNEIVFEDFIEKEIGRSQRYGYPFSLVTFKIDEKTAKKIYDTYIRKSDYFGKIDAQTYAVLLTHNGVDGALVFANKIKKIIKDIHIGISQYTTGDSVEMMLEKVYSAQEDKKEIDIEV
jgi:CPA1 family monovalent cation:H+ antiporter